MFKQEIQDCKQDLTTEHESYPAHFPYYAGRAMMADMKKHHLQLMKKVKSYLLTFSFREFSFLMNSHKILDDAVWMLPCSTAEEIFQQYDKFVTSINDNILNLYRKWVDQIGDDVTIRLNRPLMRRSSSHPGLLECNMDKWVLK